MAGCFQFDYLVMFDFTPPFLQRKGRGGRRWRKAQSAVHRGAFRPSLDKRQFSKYISEGTGGQGNDNTRRQQMDCLRCFLFKIAGV